MSDPTRIRVQLQGQGAVVRVLMSHEMESGQRKDAAGRPIAAWHITEMTAALNGKTVLTAQWGTGIARNPYTQFTLKAAKAGDTLSISWLDNRGDRRSDEVVIAA